MAGGGGRCDAICCMINISVILRSQKKSKVLLCLYMKLVNELWFYVQLPFSSIALLTREGENPMPINDDLSWLPDELAPLS